MTDFSVTSQPALQPFYSVDQLKDQAIANKTGTGSDFGVKFTLNPPAQTSGSGSSTPSVGSGSSDFGVSVGIKIPTSNDLWPSTGTSGATSTGTTVIPDQPNYMPWILGLGGLALLGVGFSVLFGGDKKGKK